MKAKSKTKNKYKKGSFFEVDGHSFVSNGVCKENGEYVVYCTELTDNGFRWPLIDGEIDESYDNIEGEV